MSVVIRFVYTIDQSVDHATNRCHAMQHQIKNRIPATAIVASALLISLLVGACGLSHRTGGHDEANVLDEVVANEPLNRQLARLAGVTLMDNGEIRLRRASAPPLVIVDGTPMGVGYGDLSFLNPAEVDRVKVVTGPDTAIYGQRGIYGVLQVTTKFEASITSRSP